MGPAKRRPAAGRRLQVDAWTYWAGSIFLKYFYFILFLEVWEMGQSF
jgi:hypothetical protein